MKVFIDGAALAQISGFTYGCLSTHLMTNPYDTSPLRHLFVISCAVGSCLSPYLSDYLGRRVSIICSAMLAAIVLTYNIITDSEDTQCYLILGICVGSLLAIAPVYAAECYGAMQRGRVVGSLIVYVYLGSFYILVLQIWTEAPMRWKDTLNTAPSLFLFIFISIGLLFAPESPHWILAHKTPYECMSALQRLRNSTDVSNEFKIMYLALSDDARYEESWAELISTSSLRCRLCLCCILNITTQFIGIIMLNNSSKEFLQDLLADFGSLEDSKNVSQLLCMFQFLLILSTIWSISYVDRLGRRKLLLFGYISIFICWILVIACIYMRKYFILNALYSTKSSSINDSNTLLNWQPILLCIGVFAITFMIVIYGATIGSTTWIYSAELFPLRARSRASSLSTCSMFISSELAIHTLIYFKKMHSNSFIVYIFIIISSLLFIIAYLFIPETANIILEDMEELFSLNESTPISCSRLCILGHRVLEYENTSGNLNIPLLRSRNPLNNHHNLEATSPTASNSKVSFEPDKLHKYSSSMHAIDYQYMRNNNSTNNNNNNSFSTNRIGNVGAISMNTNQHVFYPINQQMIGNSSRTSSRPISPPNATLVYL